MTVYFAYFFIILYLVKSFASHASNEKENKLQDFDSKYIKKEKIGSGAHSIIYSIDLK